MQYLDNRVTRLALVTVTLAIAIYLFLLIFFMVMNIDFPGGYHFIISVLGAGLLVYKYFASHIA